MTNDLKYKKSLWHRARAAIDLMLGSVFVGLYFNGDTTIFQLVGGICLVVVVDTVVLSLMGAILKNEE